MARRKKGLDVDGILLLDKPLGISSNSALQRARHLFNAKKAGHTGSLDPLATGVLPICFGQASKVTSYLLDSDKSYTCTAQLGVTTTTGDKEGDILRETTVSAFTKHDVEKVLSKFRGNIQQIPPMHSALKHNGQPLYKLARQGIEIERKARDVIIHDLTLVETTDSTITLNVKCSKGTYIRTLAQDIGNALGFGAHLSMLRRTEVSPFDCTTIVTLEQIEEYAALGELNKLLLPIDSALIHLPAITLSDEESKRIQNGLKVSRHDIPKKNMIKLYLETGQFIGIGRYSSDQCLAPKRLMRTN